MRVRKVPRAAAARVAATLLETSVRTSKEEMALARTQAELAREVMLRFNVRFDYSLKRFICHGCKKLIVPGRNARVRLARGAPATLRVTCLDCGHVNKKIIKRP